MYALEVISDTKRRRVCFRDMKPGDIGRIVSSAGYTGQLVMRRYDTIFGLDPDSGSYWSAAASHEVELLQPGDQVVLTVQ